MKRLVNMQYYYETDQVVVHEIVDGERNYYTIDKPKLLFGVKNPKFGKPSPHEFWIPKEQVDLHECSFINRYREIAQTLGYTKEHINSLSNYEYTAFKKSIITDPSLFFADNSITFQERVNYVDGAEEGEVDPTISFKVMSFDIEIHDDYNPDVYTAITDLKKYGLTDSVKLSIWKAANVHYSEYLQKILRSDINIEVIKSRINSYKELMVLLLNDNITEKDSNDLIEILIEKYETDNFLSKTGFAQEEFANNRIDAISAYDNIEKKMYLFLLSVEEDLLSNNIWYEQIKNKDESFLSSNLNKYLKMIKLRIYLRSSKDFIDKHIDLLNRFNNITNKMHHSIGIAENVEYDELLLEIDEVLGSERLKEISEIKTEVKIFDDELSLMESFFYTKREIIQPNIVLAHNNKFDFLTLYNRLIKYGKVPELYFNQLGPFFTDEDLEDHADSLIPIKMRFDNRAKNRKQDSSYIEVLGCVWLDTALLVAKMTARERDFSLNAISKSELKESKFKFEGVIQELYTTNLAHFCLYSCVDTLLVDALNDVMGLIDNFASVVDGTFSSWSEYSLKSVYLSNLIKYELFKKKGYFTRVNLNAGNKKDENFKFKGAYVTDLEKVKSYGIHEDLYDLDASRMYPSAIEQNNIMTDKLIGQWSELEFYQEAIIKSKISFGARHLNTDPVDIIYVKL